MKLRSIFAVAFMGVAAMSFAQQPADAVYGIKSGIITTQMDMMGQPTTQKTYFDDYGKKVATVSDGMGGGTMRTITVDGAQVMINDAEKTATRMPSFGGMGGGMMGGSQINFLKLTDQVKKDNNIKELGKETIAGKECTKYSITMDMMGQSSERTVWIYQGITMKSVMDFGMGAMEQTVTKLEENVSVEASMFTVPAGIEIQEMDFGGMGFGGF